jgi:sigma-B regulation protein RsbU (phosphoserine phosphatase)
MAALRVGQAEIRAPRRSAEWRRGAGAGNLEGFALIAAKHGIALDGVARPADRIGGDFFDIFEAADGRLCVALGDVAEKGPAAARVALRVRGMIREAARCRSDPAQVLTEANARLVSENDQGTFVTLCLLSWSADGSLDYACAGHHAPLVRDPQGVVRRLRAAPNIALGVLADEVFAAQSDRLGPGEALMLFTDGLTEAEGDDGRFGVARAAAAFAAAPSAAAVVAAMDAFAAWPPYDDDLAVLTLVRRRDDDAAPQAPRTGRPARPDAARDQIDPIRSDERS